MQRITAWIFVNGDLPSPQRLTPLIGRQDLLIAADGGLRHLQALGLQPKVLIGDLDSVSPDQIAAVRQQGVEILRYPVEKNETDLELAIQHAIDQGANSIRIAAALGDRLDHTLGNLFLLLRPEFEKMDLRLDDGRQEVFLIRSQTLIDGAPGDLVSLLPYGRPALGVQTERLYYPLQSETLYPDHTRGISNVMQAGTAAVSLADGLLICVHIRQPGV